MTTSTPAATAAAGGGTRRQPLAPRGDERRFAGVELAVLGGVGVGEAARHRLPFVVIVTSGVFLAVSRELEEEGAQKFSASFDSLLKALVEKEKAMRVA